MGLRAGGAIVARLGEGTAQPAFTGACQPGRLLHHRAGLDCLRFLKHGLVVIPGGFSLHRGQITAVTRHHPATTIRERWRTTRHLRRVMIYPAKGTAAAAETAIFPGSVQQWLRSGQLLVYVRQDGTERIVPPPAQPYRFEAVPVLAIVRLYLAVGRDGISRFSGPLFASSVRHDDRCVHRWRLLLLLLLRR
uniref:Uncharacterized protein n=1 Tax=Anopheles melas TaxID=34690 RepID=A0A182TEU5_9DIPT